MEPIFLEAVCKDYIWGGNQLRERFGKKAPQIELQKAGSLPAIRMAAAGFSTARMPGKH